MKLSSQLNAFFGSTNEPQTAETNPTTLDTKSSINTGLLKTIVNIHNQSPNPLHRKAKIIEAVEKARQLIQKLPTEKTEQRLIDEPS